MRPIREDVVNEATIRLDIGCGGNLQTGWVGMDVREFPQYESSRFIQHDIEDTPWPLPDSCASVIQASHIMEHVSPSSFELHKTFVPTSLAGTERVLADVNLVPTKPVLQIMDEMHRVLEHEGQAWITGPYGWSHGFVQDPTHTKPLNETLFAYFTPKDWTGLDCQLYEIYKPKPWRFIKAPEYSTGGNILVIMEALKDER